MFSLNVTFSRVIDGGKSLKSSHYHSSLGDLTFSFINLQHFKCITPKPSFLDDDANFLDLFL